jgi:trans-aconitate 2-methyltransferase
MSSSAPTPADAQAAAASAMRWDPAQYQRYSDQRSRPFFDLLAQVQAESPATVIDVGCGSGELTISLAGRWPRARVHGVDSSPEMIERAPSARGVTFALADARQLDATGTDVLISNALLQWVPGHLELLGRWAAQLNAGGWLAFQVPANFDAPSHRLMHDLAGSSRWRELLGGALRGATPVAEPAEYLALLAPLGMHVDVWQTQYLHVLHGQDPVLEWMRGTGLRPVLAALPEDQVGEFSSQYGELLRAAYPPRPYGTVFGFTRTFVVAHKLTSS